MEEKNATCTSNITSQMRLVGCVARWKKRKFGESSSQKVPAGGGSQVSLKRPVAADFNQLETPKKKQQKMLAEKKWYCPIYSSHV